MEPLKGASEINKAYQLKPTMAFDIEGTIVNKSDKNVTIATEIEGKYAEIDVRLKQELVEEVGEKVEIKKEDIVSYNVKKKPLGLEGAFEDSEGARDIKKVLEELGLPFSKENLKLIQDLMNSGIQVSKENILSYLASKECLEKLQQDLSIEMIIKMKLKGIDIEKTNLKTLSDEMIDISNQEEKKSILSLLGIKKDMNYVEAESVARKIYGQKMGKDVYDAIINLEKSGLEVSKKNIESILETVSKVSKLKGVDSSLLVKVESNSIDFTINSLYKEKNAYSISKLETNFNSFKFEDSLKTTDSELDGAKNLLLMIGEELNSENVEIMRGFILEDVQVNESKFKTVKEMKNSLDKLVKTLNSEMVASLYEEDNNILTVDIRKLAERIDSILENNNFENKKNSENADLKALISNLKLNNGKLDFIEFVKIINKEQDFSLDVLKNIINEKEIVAKENLDSVSKLQSKVFSITQMLSTIGDMPENNVIAKAYEKTNKISLNVLYESKVELEKSSEMLIKPVSETQSSFIQQEYIKARSMFRVSIVETSISEEVSLENLEISEMNTYMSSKIESYTKALEMKRKIDISKGREKLIIPMIQKNGLDFNLNEVARLSEFLKGNTGVVKEIQDLINNGSPENESIVNKIENLEKRISDSVKSGEDFSQEYKELLNTIQNNSTSGDMNKQNESNQDSENQYNFLNMTKRISRGSFTMQLPVELDGKMNNLNVVIPNASKGIDSKNMNFLLSIETERLGLVNISISVVGKTVNMNLETENQELISNIDTLETNFSSKGYKLNLEVSSN